jgi:hypothetical protein
MEYRTECRAMTPFYPNKPDQTAQNDKFRGGGLYRLRWPDVLPIFPSGAGDINNLGVLFCHGG